MFQEKSGFPDLAESHPVCHQRGPYEASEGFTPVTGEKNWGGQVLKNSSKKIILLVHGIEYNGFDQT